MINPVPTIAAEQLSAIPSIRTVEAIEFVTEAGISISLSN
jgi:hypothetical protein